MRERKCVKLNVNMYEDTKFKIIDMKPERDLIHYIWTRLITLAGKVNLEGKLYMSKNIPYTIETLAIEFNRGANQVKLALDVFAELEMIELTAENVYIVKNFAKHQNIKVKEIIESNTKKEEGKIKEVKNKEFKIKEDLKHEIYENGHKQSENKISEIYNNEVQDSKKKVIEIYDKKYEESKNKISVNKAEVGAKDEIGDLETTNKDINKIENIDINEIDDENIGNAHEDINGTKIDKIDEKNNNKLRYSVPMVLEGKKNKKSRKKKNYVSCNDIREENEDDEDNSIIEFFEGDEGRPLMEGECIVEGWSF